MTFLQSRLQTKLHHFDPTTSRITPTSPRAIPEPPRFTQKPTQPQIIARDRESVPQHLKAITRPFRSIRPHREVARPPAHPRRVTSVARGTSRCRAPPARNGRAAAPAPVSREGHRDRTVPPPVPADCPCRDDVRGPGAPASSRSRGTNPHPIVMIPIVVPSFFLFRPQPTHHATARSFRRAAHLARPRRDLRCVDPRPPRRVTVFAERCDETGAAQPQKRRRHCTPARACRFVFSWLHVSPSRRAVRAGRTGPVLGEQRGGE